MNLGDSDPAQGLLIQSDPMGDLARVSRFMETVDPSQRQGQWRDLARMLMDNNPSLQGQLHPDYAPSEKILKQLSSLDTVAPKAEKVQEKPAPKETASDEKPTDKSASPAVRVILTRPEQTLLNKLQDDASMSEQTIAKVGQFRQVLQSVDPKELPSLVGPGAELKMKARQVGQSIDNMFGTNLADENKLAKQEEIKTINMDFAIKRLQAVGGNDSDRDVKNALASVPGLTKTPEGNMKILNMLDKLEKRNMEKNVFFQNYLQNQGTLNGAAGAWNTYRSQNPVFGEDLQEYVQRFRQVNPEATEADAINYRFGKALQQSKPSGIKY